jgi:hypothetical protein
MVDAPSTPASAIQHSKFFNTSCSNASANRKVLTRQGADSDSAPAEEQAETAPDTIALDAPNDHFDNEPASSPSQKPIRFPLTSIGSLLFLPYASSSVRARVPLKKDLDASEVGPVCRSSAGFRPRQMLRKQQSRHLRQLRRLRSSKMKHQEWLHVGQHVDLVSPLIRPHRQRQRHYHPPPRRRRRPQPKKTRP